MTHPENVQRQFAIADPVLTEAMKDPAFATATFLSMAKILYAITPRGQLLSTSKDVDTNRRLLSAVTDAYVAGQAIYLEKNPQRKPHDHDHQPARQDPGAGA